MPLIEMGKQYKTIYGRDVRVLCVDAPDAEYPVIALDDSGFPERYTPDGRYYSDSGELSCNDLVEVKPEITGYVNVYAYPGDDRQIYSINDSRVEAARKQDPSRKLIACVKITFREGEGL